MARFMGYLLLSFYSSNSVKMLISQIRRGRVCVYVYGMVSHPAKCMYEREKGPAHCIAVQNSAGLPGLYSYTEAEITTA